MPNQNILEHDKCPRDLSREPVEIPPKYEHLKGAQAADMVVTLYQHVFELVEEVHLLRGRIKKLEDDSEYRHG